MILRLLPVAVVAFTLGCAWTRTEIAPRQLPGYQQVKIWRSDSVARWRAVIITADSITGIPIKMPRSCDSCRVGLPLSAVSSIRLRYPPSHGQSVVFGAALATYILAVVVSCHPNGCEAK